MSLTTRRSTKCGGELVGDAARRSGSSPGWTSSRDKSSLAPLIMSAIAKELGLSVSRVSRLIARVEEAKDKT